MRQGEAATTTSVGAPIAMPLDPRLVRSAGFVAIALALADALLGLAVLAGYAFGWTAAVSIAPGLQAMSTPSAALFCLSGASICLFRWRRWAIADALCMATGAVASCVLIAQLALGHDPFSEPITLVLFHTPRSSIGRMAPAVAAMFLLLAVANSAIGRRWPRVANTAALITLAFAGAAMLGYAYGVHDLYAAPIFHTMALHTTVGMTALATATLLQHPERPPVSLLFVASHTGHAARQQLAFMAIVPVVGWLLVTAVRAGQLGSNLAMAILVAATMAPLSWLVLSAARARTRAAAAAGDRSLLASIVVGSDDAIIGKTLSGVVTSWNDSAERMFGYTAEEMIGQTLERLFPMGAFHEEAEILARISRGERILHYETTRLRKDGSQIEVSVSISPVHDEFGAIVGVAKIARDITEQRRVSTQLAQVQNELFHVARLSDMSQMATGLAHELNQPLSAISNYISGAQKLIEKGDLDRAREGCERAAGQVARAGEVIRRLRDFVGKTPGQMRPERLANVIEESGALAFLGARGAGVQVELQLSADASEAMMDKVQIQQVIVNLVRNAAEAMADRTEKRLTVSTRRIGPNEVEVTVADTGPGLAEEVRQKLFQPFTSTKATGMGVGLSLCRTIIDAHGGRIWAENRPTGGAAFRFTLPIDAAVTTDT